MIGLSFGSGFGAVVVVVREKIEYPATERGETWANRAASAVLFPESPSCITPSNDPSFSFNGKND